MILRLAEAWFWAPRRRAPHRSSRLFQVGPVAPPRAPLQLLLGEHRHHLEELFGYLKAVAVRYARLRAEVGVLLP